MTKRSVFCVQYVAEIIRLDGLYSLDPETGLTISDEMLNCETNLENHDFRKEELGSE